MTMSSADLGRRMRTVDETQGNDAVPDYTVPLGAFAPRMLDIVGRCTNGTTDGVTGLVKVRNPVDPSIHAAAASDRRWSAR